MDGSTSIIIPLEVKIKVDGKLASEIEVDSLL